MKKLIKNALFILAAVLVMAACDQNKNSDADGKGTLVVKLTDAPFPVSLVDEALVRINKIEIRSVAPETATETEADKASQYKVLYEGEAKEFNLLDLQNGVTAELLSLNIEVGTYDLVRLYVADAEVILKDGARFNLKVPGGSSSGLKIKLSPELVVESGVESEVLLDFDVNKSFVAQGNIKAKNGIKGFIFKPVLRAMVQKYSGVVEGKVSVNETTPVAEAHVQILRADTVFSSALTKADGTYALIGLPAGTYKMICQKEGYSDALVDQVIVKAREKTLRNFTLTKSNP